MQLDRTVRQSKHGNKTQVDSPMEITSAASGSDRIGRTGDQETTETLEINCAVPLRVLEIWARDVHLSNIDCCQPLMKRTQTNESLNQQIWTQLVRPEQGRGRFVVPHLPSLLSLAPWTCLNIPNLPYPNQP